MDVKTTDGKVVAMCSHIPTLCEMITQEVIAAAKLNNWDEETAYMMASMVTLAEFYRASAAADLDPKQVVETLKVNASCVAEVIEQGRQPEAQPEAGA